MRNGNWFYRCCAEAATSETALRRRAAAAECLAVCHDCRSLLSPRGLSRRVCKKLLSQRDRSSVFLTQFRRRVAEPASVSL